MARDTIKQLRTDFTEFVNDVDRRVDTLQSKFLTHFNMETADENPRGKQVQFAMVFLWRTFITLGLGYLLYTP